MNDSRNFLPRIAGTLAPFVLLASANAWQDAPRAHAPYLAPDGTVQLIAAATLAGPAQALDALYTTQHPAVHFNLRQGDNYTAMAALTFDKSPVAPLGCAYTRIGIGDNLKIAAEPLGVKIAHATLTPGPGVPALGIIVNPANPVKALSLGQLTRIFAQGAGAGDLATWGQAGIKGDLADRAIAPFGPLATDYLDSDDPQAGEFLWTEKFAGLNLNHAYTGLPHYADVVKRVAEDPAAVGIVALNVPLAGVRVLPLKSTDFSDPVEASAAGIASGRYPLDRFVYLYLRLGKGQPLDPFAVGYAQLALSDEGQSAISKDSAGYLALTPAEAAQERARLAR